MAKKEVRKESKSKKEEKSSGEEPVQSAESFPKIPVRLHGVYNEQIRPALYKKLGYKSIMQVPVLKKIVINMGLGDAVSDPKILEEAVKELEAIAGQKPSIRKSKKAISNFKLRENMPIGAMVTLRKDKMYEFLDRLLNIALPRVRDFKGLPDKSFDGRGNYTLGIKEQIIFPEINVDKVNKIKGMDITFVTSAKSDTDAFELFTAFGFPFRKKEIN